MNTAEKAKFLAQNLKSAHDKQLERFEKLQMKKIKEMRRNNDMNLYNTITSDFIVTSVNTMDEWESEAYSELDGLTPVQFFYSLDRTDELVEIVSIFMEINRDFLSSGLYERLRSLKDSSFSKDILHAMESMQLCEDKCFTPEQRAIVRIAAVLAVPEHLDALIRIAGQLDNEKSDERTIDLVFDAIGKLGEIAIEPLIVLLENCERKGHLYQTLIDTLAATASNHKSERVYKLLKSYFRSSESKSVESGALAIYGDGRAVPAIRGYVEQHLEKLTYQEFIEFENDVWMLGGDMSDLERYFDEDPM